MDHFPLPPATPHILLPYLSGPDYDPTACPFKKFAKREKRKISNSEEITISPTDSNAFLQTWLFFGPLLTVLNCVGIKAIQSDFIQTSPNGEKFLSTARLPEFIQQWRSKRFKRGSVAEIEWKDREEDYLLQSTLGKNKGVYLTIEQMVLKDHRELIKKYCYRDNVAVEVVLAAVSAQFTLLYWSKGLGHSDWNGVSEVPMPPSVITYFQEKMVERGWCGGEALGFLTNNLQLDGMYYAAHMPSPRYEDNHEKCNDDYQECGYLSKNWQYVTQHVEDGCACAFLEVPVDEVVAVIEGKGVPIIRLEDGVLKVTKYEKRKTRYVAMSHVWSDGMGNEDQNALPTCQLERIQRLVNEVDNRRRTEPPPRPIHERMALATFDDVPKEDHSDKYAKTKLIGFWMDTLCIPVAKEHYPHRIAQIQKMHDIYTRASCVLVLDKWVSQIPTSVSIIEKAARLLLSNWQRRLWTCQEGVMAQKLYFQFSDEQRKIEDLVEEAGLYEDGPRESSLPAIVLNNIPAFNEGRLDAFDMDLKITPILNAIRPRTTSKRKDETICMATLLGKSPKKLLQITEGDDVCEKRMEMFIRMVEYFPQTLIFTKTPRLKTNGFRWAPASILRHRFEYQSDRTGVYTKDFGFGVDFPGLVFKLDVTREEKSIAISDGKRYYRATPVASDEEWEGWIATKEYVILIAKRSDISNAALCAYESGPKGLPVRRHRYVCRVDLKSLADSEAEEAVPFTLKQKTGWFLT